MARRDKKGGAVDAAPLPDEVAAALQGATFHSRNAGEGPRVIVQPAGLAGWIHSAEADAKALKSAFPELTEEQLARACRYLASLVQNHFRKFDRAERPTNWVHNW